MGSDATAHKVPTIDFAGVDPKNPGSPAWDAVRSQVFQALQSFGCFEAIYDRVSTELRDRLFGTAVEELFSLPLETKMRNVSAVNRQGYVGHNPGWSFESLGIENAPLLEASQAFTDLMWPDGNPSFCETVWAFSKQMQELEQMVLRMALESLGVEKHLDSYIESTRCGVRLMEYGVPQGEGRTSMNAHTDMNVVTILCQHQVGGLEVRTKDGEWIPIDPAPNSFTFMIGEAFQAWTNGRFEPTYHRVVVSSKQKRNSVAFGSSPKAGYLVQAPTELVDEDHPLLYNPYDYPSYMSFRFTEAGERAENALKAYCGVGDLQATAA